MREIKFRGKDKNGNWVYGYLVVFVAMTSGMETCGQITKDNQTEVTAIVGSDGCVIEVIPETVGQFTGIKDKNGKEIYEGDIIQERGLRETWTLSRRDEFSDRKHVIMWDEEQLEWIGHILEEYLMEIWNKRDLGFLNEKYTLEIIGNIHEEIS